MAQLAPITLDEAKRAATSTASSSLTIPAGAIVHHYLDENGTLQTTWELPKEGSSRFAPCRLCGFRGLVDIRDNLDYEWTYACYCPHGEQWLAVTKQISKTQFDALVRRAEK